MIGKSLSHYKILDRLGAGGMGEVYRALDTTLDREVALKVLPEDLAREPERRKRFEREAKAIAALNHPNIVTIHSVQEADGVHFLTMELVEGGTLTDKIPPGGMTLRKFFEAAIPMTDAVASAHANNVAHRDLKPSNIMFDAEGRLKVLDFGLAKLFEEPGEDDHTRGPESDTAEGKVLGTAAYMSPEQAEGNPIDHRTDIFSMGIIFYEMLTGDKPFKGNTTISTLSAVLRDTPPALTTVKPDLPHHLGRIVRRCLEKDPDRRFQTVLDLRNDLRDLKDEVLSDPSGVSDAEGARAHRAPARRGGRGLGMTLGVPLLIVVLAVAAYFVTRGGGTDGPLPGDAPTRLAVLPFENLGAADDAYFAAGITDEITAKLAGIDGLAVISRASARKYKDTDKDLRTIGDELSVDHILQGTVRWDKSGERERVRITPQLIRVSEDANLWAETYEREIDEIFAVQADIAREIAGALDVTLGGASGAAEAAPTENVAAYQSYLRSMEYDQEDEEGMRLSVDLLERAVALDPSFAVAWAELSRNHSGMYHYGYDRTPERIELSRKAADRAMALDPELIDAYIAMGYHYYWVFKDYARALEPIDYAERLAPNDPRILAVKSFVLRRQGRFEEALDYMQRGFELDPQNALTCRDISYTLQVLRRYDEAVPYAERAVIITPDYWASYVQTARVYATMGDTAKAKSTLARIPSSQANQNFILDLPALRMQLREYDTLIAFGTAEPNRMLWLQGTAYPKSFWAAWAYRQTGNTAMATKYFQMALDQLEKESATLPDDHRLESALGHVYAFLGRKEKAVQHGLRGKRLLTVQDDALTGMSRVYSMSQIYALVGEVDLALDEIEFMLDKPSDFSVELLRLDPSYDSLRDEPRYKEVVARYETRVP